MTMLSQDASRYQDSITTAIEKSNKQQIIFTAKKETFSFICNFRPYLSPNLKNQFEQKTKTVFLEKYLSPTQNG
jgi:hypothetical protein